MHSNGYLRVCGHLFMLLDVLENNLVNDKSGALAVCVSSQLGKKESLVTGIINENNCLT